jgi:putative ABC transport system permease protein
MGFVVRMATREARASWRRLLFFFLCVAVGVGAIVAIRSVIQTVRHALTTEARALTGADVLVQTTRPWQEAARARIAQRLSEARVVDTTEAVETATMVRPAEPGPGQARMVELMAVEAPFPFYGELELEGGQPYSHHLIAGGGVLVRPELLTQLDVGIGDALIIGERTFTIRGVVLREPGRRMGVFSLGPRVLMDLADLPATGLLTFGSRARYLLMVRAPDPVVDGIVTQLRSDLRDQFITVRSYRGTEDQLGGDLQRAENYLSLVGFVMVVLGGIGVWSVTRVFVQQKIRAIAVLKCLGATARQVLAVYVAQVALLGLLGSLLGVVLAGLALWAVPADMLAALGGAVPGLTASAVVQGLGIGVLVSLLFALVPLLEVRRVKPLLLLRDESETAPPRPPGAGRWAGIAARARRVDWLKTAAAGLVVVGLVAIASWQADSLRVGALVSAGFVIVGFALHLAGLALIRLVAPLRRTSWFPLRHAVISFSRPGNQTRVILLAVGLGAFFIIGVRSLQSNLLQEFSLDLRGFGADLFLVDIQPDQAQPLASFLDTANPGREARLLPVLRARVVGVEGRDVNLESYEDVRGRGALAREYVVTYRDRLEANEQVVRGAFWPASPSGEAEVSIEEGIRNRFGIDVGDRVRFDVLGRIVEARVSSVRRVEWADARAGGFMFVFRPGVLERAPHTYIAVLRGPQDVDLRAGLQRQLVEQFPNVSVIDVRDIASTVEGVLANVTFAISIVGGVALFSGLLILIGSVAMTKFQRLHEAAVFKTLGASTRTIATMLALEYATLGALGGAVGGLGSLALTWIVSREVLEIRWHPAPEIGAAGVLLTMALVGVLGVVSSVDVLRRKPLSILRAE